MRYKIILVIGTSLLVFFAGCNKTAEVADIKDISATTLQEAIVCQPVGGNNDLIAVIYENEEARLCSYNVNNETDSYKWNNSVEQYGFNDESPIFSPILNLRQNENKALFLQLAVPRNRGGYIKSVKFNQGGDFQWQLVDSIHQPDSIFFGTDTIDLVSKNFRYGGQVNLDNGGASVISSVDSVSIDSTYLQLTHYNSDGNFTHNTYLRFKESSIITDVYNTSDNNLLLIANQRRSNLSRFTLIDTTGNIFFELEPELLILKTHFFYENSDGNYIISFSYLEGSNLAHGTIFCVDKTGRVLWYFVSDIGSSGSLLLTINEQNDGYMFSGVKTGSAFFDWRDNFNEYDYQAVLMKTDLTGNIQWQNNDLFNNSYFRSAGAGVIIDDNINFFIGRDDGPIKNVAILKLDAEGKIKN